MWRPLVYRAIMIPSEVAPKNSPTCGPWFWGSFNMPGLFYEQFIHTTQAKCILHHPFPVAHLVNCYLCQIDFFPLTILGPSFSFGKGIWWWYSGGCTNQMRKCVWKHWYPMRHWSIWIKYIVILRWMCLIKITFDTIFDQIKFTIRLCENPLFCPSFV